MTDDSTGETDDRTTIRTGREFEEVYRLSADAAGDLLVDLGEQLRSGDEVTITDEEWELPFAFGGPVTVEIDFDGVGDPELEIEVELSGRPDETGPEIN
jgi:amphi-Trp domain-containing protein